VTQRDDRTNAEFARAGAINDCLDVLARFRGQTRSVIVFH